MVVCKSVFLYFVWYLSWNSLKVSIRVLVWSWIWDRAVMLNEESLQGISLCWIFVVG